MAATTTNTKSATPLVDASNIPLSELESMEESVLVQALRRLSRESDAKSDGISAHTSTTHDSFSQGTW